MSLRKPQGYAISTSMDGVKECDTFTCGHCQKVTFVHVGQSPYDLGGGCRRCGTLICLRCVDLGVCTPYEEVMLAVERKFESEKMICRLVGR